MGDAMVDDYKELEVIQGNYSTMSCTWRLNL